MKNHQLDRKDGDFTRNDGDFPDSYVSLPEGFSDFHRIVLNHTRWAPTSYK